MVAPLVDVDQAAQVEFEGIGLGAVGRRALVLVLAVRVVVVVGGGGGDPHLPCRTVPGHLAPVSRLACLHPQRVVLQRPDPDGTTVVVLVGEMPPDLVRQRDASATASASAPIPEQEGVSVTYLGGEEGVTDHEYVRERGSTSASDPPRRRRRHAIVIAHAILGEIGLRAVVVPRQHPPHVVLERPTGPPEGRAGDRENGRRVRTSAYR